MKYYQCRFEKATKEGTVCTVAWIDERGAKVGALVELKGEEGLWLVTKVSEPISEAEYRKIQTKSRDWDNNI